MENSGLYRTYRIVLTGVIVLNSRVMRANGLLFLTAVIWGFAFVAQRVGMDHVGPLTFNGIRFMLGSVALIPLIRLMEKQRRVDYEGVSLKRLLVGGGVLGLALFAGASLQQMGLAAPLLQSMGFDATTAGKAGFITGLYVVFVPILGLLIGQHTNLGAWMGAGLAVVGMYFLSVTDGFGSVAFGDMLVLASAVFWAAHVLIIGKLSPGMDAVDAVKLSSAQFFVCAVISLAVAVATEEITLVGVTGAAIPILYGGLMSVGVAYTLQVIGQRDAHPSHAAIILSLESVFGAVGGWFMLDETMGMRALFGCGLMLVGMIISQLKS